MKVKICGIKGLDDALAATDSGADLLGFNFYEQSPRYVNLASCSALVASLKRRRASVPVLVGVFVNVPPVSALGILSACGLDAAQLSGDEAPDDVAALQGRGYKAIRPLDQTEAQRLASEYGSSVHPGLPALLIDAAVAGTYGGSGRTADWTVAAGIARTMPILLGGGLRPENVADAIATVMPWGVDVASGVESAPGVKDRARMADFIRIAKASTPPSFAVR